VSFSLEPGASLGIVGESGSGKSILALSLMQLLPRNARIESGSIALDGRDLVMEDEASLVKVRGREMALVFQDPTSMLNPTRRIGSQIAEAIKRHGNIPRRAIPTQVNKLLQEVGVTEGGARARAYPHEFSGGMCQRVMLAMAISGEPKLLIADEPTTALDVTVQAQILDLLQGLRRNRGLALIIISHDVAVVARLADTIAVMYAGEFVEVAETQELIRHPEHPYTEALLEAVPNLNDRNLRSNRLRTIPGRPPPLLERPAGCRFSPRCPYAHLSDDCASTHSGMREVRPGHWVRTCHPRSERALQPDPHGCLRVSNNR